MALRPDNANYPLVLVTGAIVIWWGRIEGMLFQETMNMGLHADEAISSLCQPLQIATQKLIAQWARASRRVVADDPELQAAISKVKGELTDCAGDRHILAHGFWDYPHDDQIPLQSKITVIKPDGADGVKFEQYEVNFQILSEFHDRLSLIYHRILGITGAIESRIPLRSRPKVQQDAEG